MQQGQGTGGYSDGVRDSDGAEHHKKVITETIETRASHSGRQSKFRNSQVPHGEEDILPTAGAKKAANQGRQGERASPGKETGRRVQKRRNHPGVEELLRAVHVQAVREVPIRLVTCDAITGSLNKN